jgi:DNA-binding NarL/FixJ family response regulator
VSASEIIKELPKLSEAERRAVLEKLRELAVHDEEVRVCEEAADEQAAELDRLEEAAADYHVVDLRSRGVSEAQADDLRARLRTFAEDWERPEASIYDEDPAR